MLVHRGRAETRGRGMGEKMTDLIPLCLFVIPIQAAIGGKIIAGETVRALRKDVRRGAAKNESSGIPKRPRARLRFEDD
jgi:translation elongation factor EF-4